jgi:hypothetical protein
VSLYSCKKDMDNLHLDIAKIVFGDAETSKMNMLIYDPPMQIASWENGGHVYDSIDIYNDGTFDFAFVSYGHKWANSRYTEIYTLNNSAEILVEIIDDTIFQSFDNHNPEIPAQQVMFNANSGFISFSENDSIVSKSKINYPQMFDNADELIVSDSTLLWSTNALFTRYAEGFWYYPQDLYLHYRYGYWNNMGEKYLCIRLKNGSSTKYGWIAVSIEYNIQINVFEHTINK